MYDKHYNSKEYKIEKNNDRELILLNSYDDIRIVIDKETQEIFKYRNNDVTDKDNLSVNEVIMITHLINTNNL